MTTLLERIADMAACVGGNVEEVLVEAANEIERLRAEVQTWKQQSESYWEKIKAMERQEPVKYEFQGRDGTWHPFIDQRHYENTVADGTWPIRALYALPGAQPKPSEQDESVRKAWARFSNELHRSPDAPYPGMSQAFEQHFSQSFADREWRVEAGTWAAAWKAAKRHGAQPAPSVPTSLLVAVANLVAQMEIVSRVGFVDTPNDKDSCAAFCVAEGTWLELMSAVESLASALAAAPEAKP